MGFCPNAPYGRPGMDLCCVGRVIEPRLRLRLRRWVVGYVELILIDLQCFEHFRLEDAVIDMIVVRVSARRRWAARQCAEMNKCHMVLSMIASVGRSCTSQCNAGPLSSAVGPEYIRDPTALYSSTR